MVFKLGFLDSTINYVMVNIKNIFYRFEIEIMKIIHSIHKHNIYTYNNIIIINKIFTYIIYIIIR